MRNKITRTDFSWDHTKIGDLSDYDLPNVSFNAITIFKEDEVVAIAGVVKVSNELFLEFPKKGKYSNIQIWRAFKVVFEKLKELKITYALVRDERNSKFVEKFGFIRDSKVGSEVKYLCQ